MYWGCLERKLDESKFFFLGGGVVWKTDLALLGLF